MWNRQELGELESRIRRRIARIRLSRGRAAADRIVSVAGIRYVPAPRWARLVARLAEMRWVLTGVGLLVLGTLAWWHLTERRAAPQRDLASASTSLETSDLPLGSRLRLLHDGVITLPQPARDRLILEGAEDHDPKTRWIAIAAGALFRTPLPTDVLMACVESGMARHAELAKRTDETKDVRLKTIYMRDASFAQSMAVSAMQMAWWRASGGVSVPPTAWLEDRLRAPEARIRESAARALAADPSYVPDSGIVALISRESILDQREGGVAQKLAKRPGEPEKAKAFRKARATGHGYGGLSEEDKRSMLIRFTGSPHIRARMSALTDLVRQELKPPLVLLTSLVRVSAAALARVDATDPDAKYHASLLASGFRALRTFAASGIAVPEGQSIEHVILYPRSATQVELVKLLAALPGYAPSAAVKEIIRSTEKLCDSAAGRAILEREARTREGGDLAWLEQLRMEAAPDGLAVPVSAELRMMLRRPEPEVRRKALVVLARFRVKLAENELHWFLVHPDAVTDSAALKLVWGIAARRKRLDRPQLVEPFAISAPSAARRSALHALSSAENYIPSMEVLDSIKGADERTLNAARGLLTRAESRSK